MQTKKLGKTTHENECVTPRFKNTWGINEAYR